MQLILAAEILLAVAGGEENDDGDVDALAGEAAGLATIVTEAVTSDDDVDDNKGGDLVAGAANVAPNFATETVTHVNNVVNVMTMRLERSSGFLECLLILINKYTLIVIDFS